MYFLRRLHLYLGVILLPWVLMYGISAIPFAHNKVFNDYYRAAGKAAWVVRFERPMDAAIPTDRDAQRDFGRTLLADLGIEAPNLGVNSPNANTLQATGYSFLTTTRAIYRADLGKVTVEDRPFRVDHFLTGMHARGSFRQEGFLFTLWCVIVDLVALSFIAWVVTGWLMWWRVRETRLWGTVALLGGAILFGIFTVNL